MVTKFLLHVEILGNLSHPLYHLCFLSMSSHQTLEVVYQHWLSYFRFSLNQKHCCYIDDGDHDDAADGDDHQDPQHQGRRNHLCPCYVNCLGLSIVLHLPCWVCNG